MKAAAKSHTYSGFVLLPFGEERKQIFSCRNSPDNLDNTSDITAGKYIYSNISRHMGTGSLL